MNRKKCFATLVVFFVCVAFGSLTVLADFAFSDLANWEFTFASGAGGWSTELTIGDDGSFSGNYHDSEMGDTGESYPSGSCYWCDFTGQFSEPVMVNSYIYSVTLEALSEAVSPDTVTIADGIRYIYTTAYGLEGGYEFLIYLPGTPEELLAEGYLDWANMLGAVEDGVLTGYGIYNVSCEDGFVGYENVSELAALEAQAAAIETRLQEEILTQSELNALAYELYMLWDDEINDIWSRLKSQLSSEAMSALTTEEIAWINAKEAAVAEAGAEFEGGSMQPMIEYLLAAEWTRERVYVLWEYLLY